MRSFCKALETSDYTDIQEEVQSLEKTSKLLDKIASYYEVGHVHRMWEYASAIKALDIVMKKQKGLKEATVLDVGAGVGLLGPTLAFMYGTNVVECDTDTRCKTCRLPFRAHLDSLRPGTLYDVEERGIDNLPPIKFDAVFCISVIEHLPEDLEHKAWGMLADRVSDDGLLFITTDFVQDPHRSYTFDNLRQTNFTSDLIKQRITWLKNRGFKTIGEVDLEYKGDFVFDYTFYQIGMIKEW